MTDITGIMAAGLVGTLAAGLAWQINRRLTILGALGVLLGASVIEEFIKTGLALMASVSVPWVHVCFGLCEAVCEWRQAKSITLAVALGVVSHACFGLVTAGLILEGWHPVLAIAMAVIFHMVWNSSVWYFARRLTE